MNYLNTLVTIIERPVAGHDGAPLTWKESPLIS